MRSIVGPLRCAEPFERKKIDPMPRTSLQHKVCRNFPNHRRELEPVPREPAAQNYVRMGGMAIDHEVAIRRETVHARLRLTKSSGCPWHPRLEDLHDRRHIASHVHIAIDFLCCR